MNKKLLGLFFLTFSLVACGGTTSSTSSNTTTAEQPSTSEATTSSSSSKEIYHPSIIVPNGTPTIAIANYAVNHQENVEIVSGPQPLVAAFAAKEKDIIIAPINLGALRYNAGNDAYRLYRTIVWDNLYLVSRTEIKSVSDLNGKKITSFGKGSTPQIVLETILNKNNIATDQIDYLDNVASANSMFTSNEADLIVSAQPNLSAIDTTNAYVTSLKDFWKEATNLETYPQSAIFVKNENYTKVQDALLEIDAQYEAIPTNIEETAKNGAAITSFKEALLTKAIPNSGYKTVENEKTLVEGYYQAMIDLGLGASVGGKLPDENFYLQF